ncbi:hypothetical protein ACFOLD_15095 [Kocuria carniphila]|uniref:hypothetical protein n=1 Tax=Kocuria carniphila TaxID=262208 RepID=UPI0036071ABF
MRRLVIVIAAHNRDDLTSHPLEPASYCGRLRPGLELSALLDSQSVRLGMVIRAESEHPT